MVDRKYRRADHDPGIEYRAFRLRQDKDEVAEMEEAVSESWPRIFYQQARSTPAAA